MTSIMFGKKNTESSERPPAPERGWFLFDFSVFFMYACLLSFLMGALASGYRAWRQVEHLEHHLPDLGLFCLGFLKHCYYVTQAGLKTDTYWPLIGPQVCTITLGSSLQISK